MIVVSRAGSVAMEASDRFTYEIAPELGLRNVFKLRREYMNSKLRFEEKEFEVFGKKIKGVSCEEVETDLECPSEDEISQYIQEREKYIAEQILKKCGWMEFEKYCKGHQLDNLIHKHTACEGPDGQCVMWCPRFGKC